MRLIPILTVILTINVFASDSELLHKVFPDSMNCKDAVTKITPVPEIKDTFVLATATCPTKEVQKDFLRVAVASYSKGTVTVMAKGQLGSEKEGWNRITHLEIEPRDLRISDTDPFFQLRIQYRSTEINFEQLLVVRQHGSAISGVLMGPAEPILRKGKAFLIIAKKINGYADVAIKSAFGIKAFRWENSKYRAMTRDDLKK